MLILFFCVTFKLILTTFVSYAKEKMYAKRYNFEKNQFMIYGFIKMKISLRYFLKHHLSIELTISFLHSTLHRVVLTVNFNKK